MITVYGLTDEHGQIRYVGSTKNPSLRFNQHSSGKCGVLFNVHGLAVLARANTGDLAVQHERSWVDYFGMDNLFNKARPCSSSGAACALPHEQTPNASVVRHTRTCGTNASDTGLSRWCDNWGWGNDRRL